MGIADVDGLLESLSSRQLSEWMAYYSLEPFGDELTDIHLATIAAILANANRKKGSPAQDVQAFRLWKADARAQEEDLFARLKSWAILSNGEK